MRKLSVLVLVVLANPAFAHPGFADHVHPHGVYIAGLAMVGFCLAISLFAARHGRSKKRLHARLRARR